MEVLYGVHPIEEALKAGRRRFDHVLVASERHDQRLARLVSECTEAGVRVRQEAREQLTQIAGTAAHQGVVAYVHPQESHSIEDLFEPDPSVKSVRATSRLLLALDGVEDPQNLGALFRVADGAGVDGVVLTERRSAPLSPVAVKASAGAAEHLRVARVVNLVRALEELKRQNLWIIGLDERGTSDYDQFDFTGDCVLVLGREGAGLHDLVRRTCDHLVRIPMAGGVSSLNVSAAGAVVLYEAFRQRRAKAPRNTVAKGPGGDLPRLSQRSRKASVHDVFLCPDAGNQHGCLCPGDSSLFPSELFRGAAAQTPVRPTSPETQTHGQVIFSRSTDENGQTTTEKESAKANPAFPMAKAPSSKTRTVTSIAFTDLDLDVHLRTASKQLVARALVTVRNTGKSPLPRIPLQISSSLNWERIRVAGKDISCPIATLNSDADHTGQLHEAAVPLTEPLAPGATLQLDVTYSGIIASLLAAAARHWNSRGRGPAFRLGSNQCSVYRLAWFRQRGLVSRRQASP